MLFLQGSNYEIDSYSYIRTAVDYGMDFLSTFTGNELWQEIYSRGICLFHIEVHELSKRY